MKLYIFRHGQTDGNVKNIVQGAGVDIPLNATGRTQATALGNRLQAENLQIIYASKMQRASETARIVATASNIQVKNQSGLEEVHFGDAEGMFSDDAKEKYKEIFAAIQDKDNPERENICIPHGESIRVSLQRGLTALEEIISDARQNGYQRVGVASHGALMFNLYKHFFKQEHKFENCEYFILER